MGEKPRRIQRQRVKGWRMPPNTKYVGRPSKWGNPYRVGHIVNGMLIGRSAAQNYYRGTWLFLLQRQYGLDITELRGKDLACWCPLDEPCHADVLLEIANA